MHSTEVPPTVLDLGCETNILMLYLAFRGARVIGVDIDPAIRKSIAECVALVEGATGKKLQIHVEIHDATELALQDASVDAAVAVSSIEHMFSDNGDGDSRAVNGIARALKSGGLAVITVPTSNGGPFHE
jgi:SAM-dependent methyltransferase